MANEIPFTYRNDIPLAGTTIWELSFGFDLPDDWGGTYLGPDKTKKLWRFWEALDWMKWVLWDRWWYQCGRHRAVWSPGKVSCPLCEVYGWERV